MSTEPVLLLYSLPREEHRVMEEIAREQGVLLKKIARKRFLQPIGCHLGLPGFAPTALLYEGEDFACPMLVFFGFTEMSYDRFMGACRAAGLPTYNLKAMVTDQNRNWNALFLYEELKAEHAQTHASQDTDN